jgi:6,7-dimethyl-8-ribityllumazine synthase
VPEMIQGSLNAAGLKFGIVASRFNDFVRTGASDGNVVVVKVPGSFEIPLAAQKLARTKKYDALICLGTLIRGETPHFQYLCSEVTKGIAAVSLETGVPVAFGVLTADTVEQAIDRAGLKSGNKGFDAAMSAVEMATLVKQL